MEDSTFATLFPAASADLFEQDLVQLLGLSPDAGSPQLDLPSLQNFGDLVGTESLKQEASDGSALDLQSPTFNAPAAPAVPKHDEAWPQLGHCTSAGGTGATAALSDMTVGSQGSDEEDSNAGHGKPKRRRRVRNAKQQELNRLAQQRYRQRKKQKQVDLAATVDDLATQLAALRAKDEQIKDLTRSKASLEQAVAAQQALIQAQNVQMSIQARTIADQERALAEQKGAAERQKLDPVMLTEHLAVMLKEALAELGGLVDKQAMDKLTMALSRRLSSCGRDVRAPVAALPKAPAEQPASSMTVSCC